MNVVIVGAGRCGLSLADALSAAGARVSVLHHDEVATCPSADVVILSVPDDAISTVAQQLPRSEAVVLHTAGSRGLDVLAPHQRVGSLHPLMALPNKEVGAARLRGASFAIDGDVIAQDIVNLLGGKAISVAAGDRVAYHAAACVAANHLVVLMSSVRDIAESIGMSLDDFIPLAQVALEEVAALGPEAALTGPASRGDLATIDAHLAALPEAARPLYVALAREALNMGEARRSGTLAK